MTDYAVLISLFYGIPTLIYCKSSFLSLIIMLMSASLQQ